MRPVADQTVLVTGATDGLWYFDRLPEGRPDMQAYDSEAGSGSGA
jgi:hypothetical protein